MNLNLHLLILLTLMICALQAVAAMIEVYRKGLEMDDSEAKVTALEEKIGK